MSYRGFQTSPTHIGGMKRVNELTSGVSEINHGTFALEETFDELSPFQFDRQAVQHRVTVSYLFSSFWLKTTYR